MTSLFGKRVGAAAALSAMILAAGCGGGGSGAAPAVRGGGHPTGTTAKANLTLTIPLRKPASASAGRRSPKYVSMATAGLGVRAATLGSINAAPWQLFNVSGSSPLCTTSDFVRTCVIQITAPAVAGTQDEFQFGATDQAPAPGDTAPMGNSLSGGDIVQAVTPGAVNAVNDALTSVIGQLGTDKKAYSVWAPPGGNGTVTVNVTANDIDGGQISGYPASFTNPITFADNMTPASAFTYPNPTPTFIGLPPPGDPGTIPAPIAYHAPTTAPAMPATVTVSTVIPVYLALANPPSSVFAIDPLTVTVGGVPASAVAGLAVGKIVQLSVTESLATQFTVTVNPGASGSIAVTPIGVVPAPGGTLALNVTGLTATAPSAAPPTISIVDTNGATATISASVTP